MAKQSMTIRNAGVLVALSLAVATVPVWANTTATAQASMSLESASPGPVLVSALTGVYEGATAGAIRSVTQVPSSVEGYEATLVPVAAPRGGQLDAMLIVREDGAFAASDQSALSVMTAQADIAMLRASLPGDSQTLSQSDANSGKVMTIAQFN